MFFDTGLSDSGELGEEPEPNDPADDGDEDGDEDEEWEEEEAEDDPTVEPHEEPMDDDKDSSWIDKLRNLCPTFSDLMYSEPSSMKQNNIQFENSNLNRRHVLKLQFHQNILFEPLAPLRALMTPKWWLPIWVPYLIYSC